MSRVYLRRYKRNPDFWEVMDGKTSKGKYLSKTEAKRQAEAIRRVKKKRASKKK